MTKCTTPFKDDHLTSELLSLIGEVVTLVSLSEQLVFSELVKDGLLTVRHQLVFLETTIALKICDDTIFSKLTSEIQSLRRGLPEEVISPSSSTLSAPCQSSAQLHLSRSISGRVLKQVRLWCQNHPQMKGMLIYLENLFTALSEFADIEDSLQFEEKIVNQVVARCREVLKVSQTVHTNLYEEAWDIICKAKKQAVKEGVPVVITLVDQSAQVIMTYRMEDALLVSSDMAYKKAYTAVGMKMQSKDLAPLVQPGQWLFNLETMTDNKVVSLSGGIPIYNGDRIIGAIGVSGGNSEQDQKIAEAALL